MILHPVAAFGAHELQGQEKVRVGRELGRAALKRSARLMKLELETEGEDEQEIFPRDEHRAPLAFERAGRTWCWSTTNTRGLSCAVVAPTRVGIDAEWLGRPRLGAALRYLPANELGAMGLEARRAAFALWSAKEAVLKLTGVGMAGMGRTQLVRVPGPGRATLELDEEVWEVRQVWESEHVISIACEAKDFTVELDHLLEAQA